jgi:hypothetical protein
MTQVVEHLPSKHKALSSNPTTAPQINEENDNVINIIVPQSYCCLLYYFSISSLAILSFMGLTLGSLIYRLQNPIILLFLCCFFFKVWHIFNS